jgi:hypothetical protein
LNRWEKQLLEAANVLFTQGKKPQAKDESHL